jgi:hypothetical protein
LEIKVKEIVGSERMTKLNLGLITSDEALEFLFTFIPGNLPQVRY